MSNFPCSTDKLAPTKSETDLIQQLVLQFLQHDGYVDTARAFAKEIWEEKSALAMKSDRPVQQYNISDDEDTNRRQSKFSSLTSIASRPYILTPSQEFAGQCS